MKENWLEEFIGQHITVFTTTSSEEKSDTGTLMRLSDGWIQMVKDNGEMILVPTTAIRIIKLLDLAQTVPLTDPTAHLTTHIYDPNTQIL